MSISFMNPLKYISYVGKAVRLYRIARSRPQDLPLVQKDIVKKLAVKAGFDYDDALTPDQNRQKLEQFLAQHNCKDAVLKSVADVQGFAQEVIDAKKRGENPDMASVLSKAMSLIPGAPVLDEDTIDGAKTLAEMFTSQVSQMSDPNVDPYRTGEI